MHEREKIEWGICRSGHGISHRNDLWNIALTFTFHFRPKVWSDLHNWNVNKSNGESAMQKVMVNQRSHVATVTTNWISYDETNDNKKYGETHIDRNQYMRWIMHDIRMRLNGPSLLCFMIINLWRTTEWEWLGKCVVDVMNWCGRSIQWNENEEEKKNHSKQNQQLIGWKSNGTSETMN